MSFVPSFCHRTGPPLKYRQINYACKSSAAFQETYCFWEYLCEYGTGLDKVVFRLSDVEKYTVRRKFTDITLKKDVKFRKAHDHSYWLTSKHREDIVTLFSPEKVTDINFIKRKLQVYEAWVRKAALISEDFEIPEKELNPAQWLSRYRGSDISSRT